MMVNYDYLLLFSFDFQPKNIVSNVQEPKNIIILTKSVSKVANASQETPLVIQG
jgi:hypothetical protein